MSEVLTFKTYARGNRNMVVEEDYQSGINFTDSTIDGAYVRMLLNYAFKDDGMLLVPRGGVQEVASIEVPITTGMKAKYPFATFTSNVDLTDNAYLEDFRTKCFMIAEAGAEDTALPEYSPERKAVLFANSGALLYVQDPVTGAFSQSTLSTEAGQSDIYYLGEGYNNAQTVHGFDLKVRGPHKPIHAPLNNITYLLYRKNNTLNLGKLVISKTGTAYTHKCEAVTPMTLTVKEVLSSGYNMLLPEPYTFSNTAASGYSIEGILPYTADAAHELLLSARPGQKINFEVYYQYKVESGKSIRVKWEWMDPNASDGWQVLQTEKANNTDNPDATVSADYTPGDSISYIFEPPVNQFQLRVSFYMKTGDVIDTKPTKMMVMPIYKLTTDVNTSTKNLKPVKYNLATASGITTWKQRLILWGVSGAENVIFTSDINNPAYFPYPNNIDIFDENIIHIEPFMDNLLVITETRIYMLSLLEDGIGFSSQLVQSRLGISPLDKHVIQIIKNMIYFKSDNNYYMIVPKTNSIKGELIIAPVSKPIVNMLENFREAIVETLESVYFRTLPKEYNLELINYYNYVDNTIVRNIYTFQMSAPEDALMPFDTFMFNFVLNYDTTMRTWTTHCYQCNGTLIPFKQTITDSTILLDVCNRYTDGVLTSVSAQLLRTNPSSCEDTFKLSVSPRRFPNYQYLDTGYRAHGAQHKKRYRELQLKLNNTSRRSLEFYTEFLLDDDTRKTFYKYETRHNTDPEDPNYGLLYVERVIDPNLSIAGATQLADIDDPENYCWSLDTSKFPPQAVSKVRLSVSGKGYAPRLKFISFNEQPYELLNLNWVFRTLYAR